MHSKMRSQSKWDNKNGTRKVLFFIFVGPGYDEHAIPFHSIPLTLNIYRINLHIMSSHYKS